MSVFYLEKNIHIRAAADSVWQALTNPQLTRLYFSGCELVSQWQVGSSLHFNREVDGMNKTIAQGEITEVEPQQHLVYTYLTPEQADDPAHDTVVSFRLSEAGSGTELYMTQGPFVSEQEKDAHERTCGIILTGLKEVVENPDARAARA